MNYTINIEGKDLPVKGFTTFTQDEVQSAADRLVLHIRKNGVCEKQFFHGVSVSATHVVLSIGNSTMFTKRLKKAVAETE